MGRNAKDWSLRAQQLPLIAISLGLEAWERSRGLREFALRRGSEALQVAAHTPLGKLLPQQFLDDGADEEAARIVAVVADAREAAAPAPAAPAPAQPAPAPAQPPAAESEAAREVGAPGAVTHEVEQIVEHMHVDAPSSRDELPIPDFDNISIGSLRARLRALSVQQLVILREWETEHANRLNVITTLDNRIAKLGDAAVTGTDYPQEASTGG